MRIPPAGAGELRLAMIAGATQGFVFALGSLISALISVLGCAGFALAATLPAGAYLLANNIGNTTVNILLVIWSVRFVQARLERIVESLGRG